MPGPRRQYRKFQRILTLIRREVGCFGNRTVHYHRSRISRSGERARAGATPARKAVAAGWRSADRYGYPAIVPATARSDSAAGSVGHGQIILVNERGCVSSVLRWRDVMRNGSSAGGPSAPRVTYTGGPSTLR